MKPFIQDKERILDVENDLLKTKIYSENLVKVIDNTPKDKVFTIGVFGGWGTGKSSIIKTAQHDIEKKNKDVRFITYDAWKYSNDSFRRMFLLKVQQDLKMQSTDEMNRFYQSETAEAEPRTKIKAMGIVRGLFVLLFLSILLCIIPKVPLSWKVIVPSFGTFGALLYTLINGCFYDLKISFSKPALFAPEQFEACFKEMMSKAFQPKPWIQKLLGDVYVRVVDSSIVGIEKLIIVIDNIDRCPSDMAYQLLTDVKTFLGDCNDSLVFIVPVDDEALKKHLFRRSSKNSERETDINKEKEEFLRKFFNVTLRIKPHQELELQHFAHKINEENHLGYNNDTLAIVSKEFADNPRRIIQLLNNLSGELALYEDEFAAEYETPICTALILREEYPDFYKKATKDLNVLIDNKKETETENKSLSVFLRISRVIFQSTPIHDLHRIFTNTASIFSALPTDIKKAVKTFDATTVISFAQNNNHLKENLLDFIFAEVKSDVRYGATSQTTQWLDCLCTYNEAFAFDHSRLNAIEESLSDFYLSAVKDTRDADQLCKTAHDMDSAGFGQLKNTITEYLKSVSLHSNANYSGLLSSYLRYFQSVEDSKAISSTVESYYTGTAIDRDIPYSGDQIAILFGDSFVAKQVEALSSMDDESSLDEILWCLSANKNLSNETLGGLFGKFITFFGATRGKSKNDYLKFIQVVLPVLNEIRTSSLPKEAASLYKFVTDPWKSPHPSYLNYPQHDIIHNLVDEVKGEEAKILASFVFSIIRISGGSVNVSPLAQKLFPKCEDAFISAALKLKDEGVSLVSIAHTLSSAHNYESKDTQDVLEIILSRQPDGSMMLDDKVMEMIIHELVNKASIPGVEQLIGRLSKDTQIQGIVSDYICTLDSETANALPFSIIKNAISIFNKDSAETFKDNISFLRLVIETGYAEQKAAVVTLMLEKILHEVDMENALHVLDSLETDNQSLIKQVIRSLESLKEKDTVDGEIKNQATALISKLSTKLKQDKPKGLSFSIRKSKS